MYQCADEGLRMDNSNKNKPKTDRPVEQIETNLNELAAEADIAAQRETWISYARNLEEEFENEQQFNAKYNKKHNDPVGYKSWQTFAIINDLQEKFKASEYELLTKTNNAGSNNPFKNKNQSLKRFNEIQAKFAMIAAEKTSALEEASHKIKRAEHDYNNLWEKYQQLQNSLTNMETLELEHEKNLLKLVQLQAELEKTSNSLADTEFKAEQYSRYEQELSQYKKDTEVLIKNLEEKLAKTKLDAEEARNNAELLNKQLTQAKKDREDYKGSERELKQKLAALQLDADKLQQQYADSVNLLQKTEHELITIRDEARRINNALHVAGQEREQLKHHNANLLKSIEKYKFQHEETLQINCDYEKKLKKMALIQAQRDAETLNIAKANEQACEVLASLEAKYTKTLEEQDNLAAQVGALQESIKKTCSEKNELLKKSNIKDSDIRNLRNSLAKAEIHSQTLNEQIKSLETVLQTADKSKQELKQLQSLAVDNKFKIDKQNIELDTLKGQIKQLEEEVAAARRKEQEYIAAIQHKEAVITNSEKAHAKTKQIEENLRVNLEKTEKEVKFTTQSLSSLKQELTTLQQREKQERDKAIELEHKYLQLKTQLDEYGSLDKLRQDYTALKSTNIQLAAELKKVYEQKSNINIDVEKLEQTIEHVNQEKSAARAQIKTLEQRIGALQQIINSKQHELAQIGNIQKQLEIDKQQFQARIIALEQENSHLSERLDVLQEEFIITKECATTLDVDQTGVNKRLQDLELDKLIKQKEISKLKADNDKITNQCNALITEKRVIEQDMVTIKNELKYNNKLIQEYKLKITELTTNLDEKQRSFIELNNAKQALQLNCNKLTEKVEALTAEVVGLSEANGKLTMERNNLADRNKQANVEIKRLTTYADETKQQMDALMVKVNAQEHDISALTKTMQTKHNKINELIAEKASNKTKIMALQGCAEDAKSVRDELTAKINDQIKIIHDMKAENNNMQERIAALINDKLALEKKLAENNGETKSATEQVNRFKREMQAILEQIRHEQGKNKDLQDRIRELNSHLELVEREKQDLNLQVVSNNEELNCLRTELSNLRRENSISSAQGNTDKSKLQHSLAEKKSLLAQIKNYERNINKLELELQDVNGKLVASEEKLATQNKQQVDYENIISEQNRAAKTKEEIYKRLNDSYHELLQKHEQLAKLVNVDGIGLNNLANSIEAAGEKSSVMVDNLTSANEAYRRKLIQSEHYYNKANAALLENNAELANLRQENAALRKEREQLSAAHAQALEANQQLIYNNVVLESYKSKANLKDKKV